MDPERLITEACASGDPAKALLAAALAMRNAGRQPDEILRLFDKHRSLHQHDRDEGVHDAILELMDRLTGWCGRDRRIFPGGD